MLLCKGQYGGTSVVSLLVRVSLPAMYVMLTQNIVTAHVITVLKELT